MNTTFREKVSHFLHQEVIAVAGVSEKPATPGRAIVKRFREAGYKVYQINPNHQEIDGEPCYASVREVPERVHALVSAAPPRVAEALVKDCIDTGVWHLWFHRSVDGGSYDSKADKIATEHGISVIRFGCPLMFLHPDFAHRCIRWVMNLQGKFKDRKEPIAVE